MAHRLRCHAVAAPILDKEAVGARIGIGDCVPAMTTAGVNGFITRGMPAATDKAAEIRVVSESTSTLLVQVFDPAPGICKLRDGRLMRTD